MDDVEINDLIIKFDENKISPEDFFSLIEKNTDAHPIASLIYVFYLINHKFVYKIVEYHLDMIINKKTLFKVEDKIRKIKSKRKLLDKLGITNLHQYQLRKNDSYLIN